MTAVHDIALRQGNTFRRRFRFKGFDGNPVDLSGSVVTLTIGRGSQPQRHSTGDGSLAILSAVAGEVELHLTAAQTRELPVEVIPYEVERAILDQRTNQWDEATILTGSIVVQKGMNDER